MIASVITIIIKGEHKVHEQEDVRVWTIMYSGLGVKSQFPADMSPLKRPCNEAHFQGKTTGLL